MKSLVIGHNGQDAKILAGILSKKGPVYTLTRSGDWFSSGRQCGSVNDPSELLKRLELHSIQSIFFTSSWHGPTGFDYMAATENNAQLICSRLLPALDYCRNSGARLDYLSSSLCLQKSDRPTVDNLAYPPSNTYVILKNCSADLIQLYTSKYKVRAAVYYLFNHETVPPREGYLLTRLAKSAKRALDRKCGYWDLTEFGNLNFYGNWGDAREYMERVVDCSCFNGAGKYLVGSSWTINVKRFVEDFANARGIKCIFGDQLATFDSQPFEVDTTPLCTLTGSSIESNASTVFKDIIEYLENEI